MIDIRNLEEKKRIIVLYKCLFNRYPESMLCNSRIYDVWIRKWKDDFVVDGKCLKMWHQKFVESVAKHKHHVEPPAYYAEDELLEIELLEEVLENLSEVQRDILKLKLKGYSNKEVHLSLKIPILTYYKELDRIKGVFKELVG